ncbi:MAG: elongation factor P [Dehalococcoidia bacterium]|nr:elongation factor P [Dehalococcoidia bacterium]
MTIGFGDLRRGVAIEVEGHPYEVVEYERQKMQQRAPVTRLRLKSLRDGRVIEKAFQSYTTEFSLAEIEVREAQYLYSDGRFYTFMDMETYDQYQMSTAQLGDATNFLKGEEVVEVVFYRGEVLNIRVPTFVDLLVTDTPPGFKGDTASGGTKPAVLETGLTVQVPLFIMNGETVKVDTRSSQYIERVA